VTYTQIKNKTKALNELGKRIKLSDKLIECVQNPEEKVHYTEQLMNAIESYKTHCDTLTRDVEQFITKEKESNVRTLAMYKLRKSLREV